MNLHHSHQANPVMAKPSQAVQVGLFQKTENKAR
jgi:hypothetical protein